MRRYVNARSDLTLKDQQHCLEAPNSNREKEAMLIDTALIRTWIVNNLDHVKGLNDVAPHFGILGEGLRKVFKRRIGVPFSEYLREQRVLKAQQLLQDTHLTCRQICFAVGFSRVEVGKRAFKRITGSTMNNHRNFRQGNGSQIGLSLNLSMLGSLKQLETSRSEDGR